MSGSDFLSRWSRRKREIEAAEKAEPQVDAAGPSEPLDPTAANAVSPEEAADAGTDSGAMTAEDVAQLPPVETLTSETDLTPFLRSGVPTVLRNAALRRMWSLDPAIRDYVSEAREYAYDWNIPGGVPGQGPMLPTDDIKGMLRAIFGEAEPAADPASGPGPEVAAAEIARPASSDGSSEGESEAPEPADAKTRVAIETGDGVPAAMISQETAAGSAEAESVAIPRTQSEPSRVRRHGGAAPI